MRMFAYKMGFVTIYSFERLKKSETRGFVAITNPTRRSSEIILNRMSFIHICVSNLIVVRRVFVVYSFVFICLVIGNFFDIFRFYRFCILFEWFK